MSWTVWAAVVVVCVTVWALIKRYETRLVLLVSGLVMALLSLDPTAVSSSPSARPWVLPQ